MRHFRNEEMGLLRHTTLVSLRDYVRRGYHVEYEIIRRGTTSNDRGHISE